AYVFRHAIGDTSDWSLVRKLEATTQIGNIAEYGTAVDISGQSIIVGAQKGGTGSTGGLAFIYDRDAGGADNWGEVKLLVDDIFDSNANFGVAVAIDGDTAVVGASLLDLNQFNNEGGFYIYNRNQGGAGAWGQTNRFFANVTRGSARFGRGVDIEGNTIAVGSWNFGLGDLSGTGRVYFYDNPTGTPGDWTEVTFSDAPTPAATAFLGQSLALVGETVVAGAAGELASQGQAYAYQKDQGGTFNWGFIETFSASDGAPSDGLGLSVAASAQHIVIGAPGNEAGAVYVYAGPGGDEPDTDGDGVIDSQDNCTNVANIAQTDSNADGFGNECDADLNNDCVVNVVDLGILRSVFFSANADADFNGDGVVNVVDLGMMRALFFAPPGPSEVGVGCP
ncbi:MAG: thrombospondin type 3 repeat-containing protein, partial [Gammaproteobacteria bacterium]